MDISQSFEIQNTPAIQKFTLSTTGITKNELNLIEFPQHITLSQTLTPKTRILVTYKAIFTAKHIQALHWGIPIVSADYLYDLSANYKKYEMKPFQGARFCTSGVQSDIYANYFILSGAKYESNCSIFIDFLICDNFDSEKHHFCKKYGIPIISTSDVLKSDFSLFMKKLKYDAKKLNPQSMFFEKIFYLDPKLPKQLFNRIRRIIIENEGTRVSSINDDVNYIITFDHGSNQEYQSKMIYYQFIFDCKESNSLLYPEFYTVFKPFSEIILPDCIAVVDKKLTKYNEIVRKLICLGALVKTELNSRITHYISKSVDSNIIRVFKRSVEFKSVKTPDKSKDLHLPFKIVSPDWIDQCLISLKLIKENKYTTNRLNLSLRNKTDLNLPKKEVLFQFTSLPSYFKELAIKKFKEYNISYLDAERYENCTHLIAGSISSSEKIFSGIASGCWILRPDFIQDFQNQLNFEYEKYEWTSSPEMDSKDKKIADAIKKWRIKIQEGGNKPFYRWNVKIYCSKEKEDNYSSLILNGGGSMNPLYEYTHIFVDKSYNSEVKEPNAKNVNYIFSYILQ